MSEERRTRKELIEENRRLRAELARVRESPSTGPASGDVDVSEGADLFREAFHLGPAALAVTRLSDGRFIAFNEQFLNLSGYDRDELHDHSSLALGLWPSERMRRLAVERLRAHGEILDVEFCLQGKGGHELFMLGSCRYLTIGGEECMLVSCIDVSERRRFEMSQQESEKLFRKVFRLSPAGVTLSRLFDGRFTDVNPEFCRLSGYDREELIGRSSRELGLWTEEDRSTLVERIKSEGVIHDYEFTLNAADGWPTPVMGSFQLLSVGGEEMLLKVISDITARKRTEESLRQAKKEAEELAQFRSSVIANITHEVRTPLTVILGFTSILREGVEGPHRRFVDLIERSGRRLLMTLDSVLDLAQLESGTLDINARPHNILDIVDSVANTTRPFAEEKGLVFEAELPEEALYAAVDYELLARALGHLVDNAIKFTDEGRVTLRVRSEGEQVLIDVVDTGIGIREEFVSKLFETFSQESSGMDRDYQGSGMGLAVTARLVERFDGTMRVESEKGVGSVFTIVLPAVESMSMRWSSSAQVA